MSRWFSIYRPLVALAWLGSVLGCSSYDPQGQFWSGASGPFSDSGGAAQGGTLGAAAGVGATGNSAGGATSGNSFAGSSSFAGGDSVGGNNSAGGSSSFAGSNAAGGGVAVGGNNSAGSTSSQGCSLSVTVTTTAPGGNYAPRNVGAIWIADSNGKFVKSLEVWGMKRISRVVAWNAATRAAGVAANEVDAVTSATLSSHRTHKDTWNCRDYNEQPVPDGSYRVYFEVADSNNAGPNHFEPFEKGASPSTVNASSGNFVGITLTFTP